MLFEEKYLNIYANKKALIGCYNKHFAELLEKHLINFGFKVEIVSTADEVFKKVITNSYDIIFSNSIYQDGNITYGAKLLSKLRDLDNFETPVIVYSVYKTETKFLSEGFDGYLLKSFELEKLPIVLENALKQSN